MTRTEAIRDAADRIREIAEWMRHERDSGTVLALAIALRKTAEELRTLTRKRYT